MESSEPIAIVGSACRFPGSADSPSALWELLNTPRDVLKDFPPERLDLRQFYSPNGEMHGRTDVPNRSYILDEDCRVFDPGFFRISPKEAHGIDPQSRLMLETVFEAVETAGWPLETIEGSLTSVHMGSMTADYNDIQMRDPDSLPTYTATGLAKSILSNRVSYVFDLKGPSVTVDTACSSSLVALHQAVQGLRNGEADQAIVGGVNLLLDPSMYITESTLHMLSQESRCRMWDKEANGYARGEGCGVVVLKPLSRAVADGDHVECIIRETGVNSDGRTNGITMPSAAAQAELIRKTYKRAGLDAAVDGCQYFECHGTGTKAGDPIEAQAISEAFFPDESSHKDAPLYCGSVKTVIGHLEGAAGLAGLMKASLAIQKRIIPPNMHFTSLHPAIEPYYTHLRVPTSAVAWPDTNSQPLRASVNSFGFGGTNAHVILESYQPPSTAFTRWQAEGEPQGDFEGNGDTRASLTEQGRCSNLFLFSAKTPASLVGNLSKIAEYIKSKPSLDLNDLSSTLLFYRSTFAFRVSIVASSRSGLLTELQKRIDSATEASSYNVIRSIDSSRTEQQSPVVLGVFTGQGAQWASMGRELMLHSATFRESILRCEHVLSLLEESPPWSLTKELIAGSEQSRISQAQFSQPLCTAIQIALVDLLHAVGVRLNTVVGHSSGEIGAAYAAGLLNTKDAMGIAFYRGLLARQAKGTNGQGGGMMAVGMSYEDATHFCSQSDFCGRITVAASNSPSSVTLSGDLDAIHEAKQVLDKEQTFARVLKVDTAYHSHHMLSCEAEYLAYLRKMEVQVHAPRHDCTWFSSVHPEMTSSHSEHLGQLRDQYWVDNMTQGVLFSQAVTCALKTSGSVALALEVGPHPALKGPINQTRDKFLAPGLSRLEIPPLPYAGCLERDSNDVKVMSNVLGMMWSYLGPSAVDLGEWYRSFTPKTKMLKDLPTYSWNHDHIYWHESRISQNYRLGQHTPHELLGRLREVCQQEITWRNILRLEEVPWLRGHKFQGQVIFPGAGYVSMAVQAAKAFVGEQRSGQEVRLLEIHDLSIIKATVMEEDSPGVEVLSTLKARPSDGNTLEAEFTVYACSDQRVMNKSSQCRLLIHLTGQSSVSMPLLTDSLGDLPSLDVDQFFSAVQDLGIHYEGQFRALRSIERARGLAKGTATWRAGELDNEYHLHPAWLDVAFQVGLASFLSMAEKATGTTYLPASIRSMVIDFAQLGIHAEDKDEVLVTSQLITQNREASVIEVDLDVCGPKNGSLSIQVEGLAFRAVGEPLAADDRILFSKTVWGADISYGLAAPQYVRTEQDEVEYIDAVERTALFFLRTLREETPQEEIKSFKPHHQALFKGIDKLISPIRRGQHTVIKKDWLTDTREIIDEFARRYKGSVDLALLTAVGENLPSAVRGKTEILEHMLKENLLGRLYTEGRGFSTCNEYVAGFMRQISFKYPRTRILEIGAGTGGTTSSVLAAIGDAYVSYTYTDISAGFFESARERFTEAEHKMEFRTFNAEHEPSQQGLLEGGYDVIIAANVLHATRRLEKTMQNVRTLLRPGGYLIAVEVTGSMLREPGLMGGLEGWWLGEDDGRFPSPGISSKNWDHVLRKTGFSGVDTIAYDMPDIARHNCSVFVTQAMDERLEVLRDPLASMGNISGPVIILGGQTLPVVKFIQRAQNLMKVWTPQIQVFTDLEELRESQVDITGAQVLYLAELDEPIFSRPLTPVTLESLQELLATAQNVLWVTSGCHVDNPRASMAIGIGRALTFELPHVRLQFMDFDRGIPWDAETMVQHFLRMIYLSREDTLNMLWSHEQEIVVSEDRILVSRIIMDEEANVQFNAGRRRLQRRIGPSEDVEISYGEERPSIVLSAKDRTSVEGKAIVDVALSTPLDIEDGGFLAFGKLQSGVPTIVLSDNDRSTCHVRSDERLELPLDTAVDARQLSAMASAILGQICVSLMPDGGTTLIFAPPEGVEEIVQREATRLGRKVMFVSTGTERRPGWLLINHLERLRTLRLKFPEDTTALLHFSGDIPKGIVSALPSNCAVQMVKANKINRQDCLAQAYVVASSLESHPTVTPINRIEQEKLPIRNVLDWRQRGDLEARVQPLNTHGFFAPDKTYLLVGMTGELGQSLCQFMIDCGARNIVMASRNPPSGYEEWFKCSDRTADLRVKMVKMDVTSQEQVRSVVFTIRQTMPEIAGVANAALVLDDSLFINTSVAAVEKQLQPKVDGTCYLDEEFSACDLDFFICFSSLGSVFGNAGQSIYHAANMFTTSLVENRRRRGQAGSVIHVGMIVDAGYVARSTRSGANIEKHLRSQFYMPLAEKEFHHLILQGILVGKPDPSNYQRSSGEVTMGIQRFVDDPDAPRPQWFHDPRLSHMILSRSSSQQTSSSDSQGQKGELTALLAKASSVPEATDVYQKLFCIKIESLMKIPSASIDTRGLLSNLGLDSLLAMEIRAWLLRDMNLDIPLLGILSRESISSICAIAAQQLLDQRTTNEQSEAIRTEPSDWDAGRWQMSDKDTSDDTTSTRTTTSVDAGLSSPVSPPMTPLEAQNPVINEHKEEIDPRSDSPLKRNEFTLPAAGLAGPKDAPMLERVESMSYSQASMHFLHNFLDDATTFNVVARYKVRGPLNDSRFQRALEKALARHDMYRTRFSTAAGGLEPKQCLTPSGDSPSRLLLMPAASTAQVEAVFEDLTRRRWQLDRGDTFLCVLTHDHDRTDGESEVEAELNTIIFGCHHIIMDGISWDILLNDLDRAYRLLPLDPVPFSYADFSRQQLGGIQSGLLNDSLAFWMDRLDPVPGVIPLLPLSHRRNRKATRVYENHTVQRELAPQTHRQIKSAAQSYGATPMHMYLVAWQILLLKLLHQDELCIGITDAGRGASGHFGQTVGHFTNLLPMKFSMENETTMAQAVSQTSQVVTEGYTHAEIPLNLILDELHIQRSPAYPPLFQIAFNYRVGDLLNRQLGNCQMDLVAYRDARTPYDLTLNVTRSSSGSQLVELTSNTHLYTRQATQRLIEMYTEVLDTLSSVNQATKLGDLKLLPAEDVLVNHIKSERAWPGTLTERLQQVWIEYPNSPAIKDDTASLTYEELRIRIQDLARAFLQAGIRRGMRVAVLCNPGIDSYSSMLALLWVGAVYIPLDVTLPTKRLQAMMTVCKAEQLIFHPPTSAVARALLNVEGQDGTFAVPTCDLAEVPYSSRIELTPDKLPRAINRSEEEGYSFILFTSGSTGAPKGIKLSQAGIMNYAAAKSTFLGISPGVRVLQQSSLGFDMAIAQAFNAFANAGTLIVAPLKARGDPNKIAQIIASEDIEFMLATPTEYLLLTNYANDILRACKAWRWACSGGETVTGGLINELQRLDLPQLAIADCYGPTEISCAATFRKICLATPAEDDGNDILGESSSVGWALPNTSVYIVGDDGQKLHCGQPGEICIGGCGVAQGYLDDVLNVDKFVQDPFATQEEMERGWRTMYRTGDRGCLLPDGSLVFLGRRDLELVKLRGLRIELGEVSNTLLDAAKGLLTDAAVTVRGEPEFLVAHVVFAQGVAIDAQRELLAGLLSDLPLPRYMVPSRIIPLERLPMTPNGKLDRLAIASLPLPQLSEQDEVATPLTVAQGELRLLWKEVLGDVLIRAGTDFFAVGGSSLLLVRLQGLLKERMGVEIPLHALYQASTLCRMAALASHERGLIPEEAIDWEQETAIPQETQRLLRCASNTLKPSSQLRILLTGATGFLGSEILRVLIVEKDVAEIHCVAVPTDKQQALLDLSNKVTVYTGSLLSPTIGLGNSEQELLQTNIQSIIHAGSHGHCLNNYSSVKQANYISTQFLVNLALPYRIPIHFISSPRVILQSGSFSSPERSLAEHPPSVDGSQGFTASKWASERFLERVVTAQEQIHDPRPLPVVVHRACSLIGERAPHDDAMNSVIRYSIVSGTVPHLPNAQGLFDFKDVLKVASDIGRGAVASALAAGGGRDCSGVVYRHHSSNLRVPFNELSRRLETLYKGSFTVVSMSEWLRTAVELGIEELIVSYLEANVAGGGTLLFPYLGE